MALRSIKLVNRKDGSEIGIPREGGILGRSKGFATEYFQGKRFVSGEHIHIYCRDDDYVVIDKNSRSGSALNGKAMVKEREYLLSVGDVLNIADLVFTVAADKNEDARICLDLSEEKKKRIRAWSAESLDWIRKAGESLKQERFNESIDQSGEAICLAARAILNIAGEDGEDIIEVMQGIMKLAEHEIISPKFYEIMFDFVGAISCNLCIDEEETDEAQDAAATLQLSLEFLYMLREVLYNPRQKYVVINKTK